MTRSTNEIIKSKKYVFLILSIIIFISGVVFGLCLTTLFRMHLFDPMRDFHKARHDFIDNTAALANSPEKESELKKFLRDYFWQKNNEKFAELRQQSVSDISNLKYEIKDKIPEAKMKQFEQYLEKMKESIIRFAPPPPPLPPGE